MDQIHRTPWCQKLLDSPNVEKRAVESRKFPGDGGPNENAFFGKTMASASGVNAMIAVVSNPQLPVLKREMLCIVSVGTDLDSHTGVLAGGALATILDETLGLIGREVFARDGDTSFYTVELVISFKKPVMTPTILLTRTHITSQQGRKMRVEGHIEDGSGTVYCTAKCLFISSKASRHFKL